MLRECVLWTGATAGKGYGVTTHKSKKVYAHRVAYEQAFGPIPHGHVIAHHCDNPRCVNPAHLFACTQAENMRDKRAKGREARGVRHGSKTRPERTARGERVGTAKLTAEQVAAIRAEYQSSPAGKRSETSLSAIARRFGVTFQTVHKIVRGQRWKHL